MHWCVTFPEEQIVVVRPSLNAICAGQRSAAKLLSVLLYRCSTLGSRQSNEQVTGVEEDTRGKGALREFPSAFSRTQAQLALDVCGELSEKTLHDVAIPTLELLGYVEVDTTFTVHRYRVHLERVRAALQAYRQGPKTLEKVLLHQMQYETFLIDTPMEKVLFNKKFFHKALEKVLLARRTFSPSQKGSQPRAGGRRDSIIDPSKNQRKIPENQKECEDRSAAGYPYHAARAKRAAISFSRSKHASAN